MSRDPYEKWLTRNQVIDMLGVSHQTLRNWEAKGRLSRHTMLRPDEAGCTRMQAVYDPQQVARLPRRERMVGNGLTPGEVAARAYEMFDEGASIREIVKQLREPSDVIRELHQRWLDDGGAELVLSPAAKAELEKKIGAFATVADLVERVGGGKPGTGSAA